MRFTAIKPFASMRAAGEWMKLNEKCKFSVRKTDTEREKLAEADCQSFQEAKCKPGGHAGDAQLPLDTTQCVTWPPEGPTFPLSSTERRLARKAATSPICSLADVQPE